MTNASVTLSHSRAAAVLANFVSLPLTFAFAIGCVWVVTPYGPELPGLPAWVRPGLIVLAVLASWMSWLGVRSRRGWWDSYTLDANGIRIRPPSGDETFVAWADVTSGTMPVSFVVFLNSPKIHRPVVLLNDSGWNNLRPAYLAAVAAARRELGSKLRVGGFAKLTGAPN